MNKPTLADDCDRLVQILSGAPIEGYSMDEIQVKTLEAESWSLRTINSVLCALGSKITHQKIRTRHGKVTKFKLKGI